MDWVDESPLRGIRKNVIVMVVNASNRMPRPYVDGITATNQRRNGSRRVAGAYWGK